MQNMDTPLCVRIFLVSLSIISLALQVIGLVGHSWFGFSLTVDNNGQIMTQGMHGGLLYFSPLNVCIDDGNGSMCKTTDQMSQLERKSFDGEFLFLLLLINVIKIQGNEN